jgi:nucleoid DNA-binding protein
MTKKLTSKQRFDLFKSVDRRFLAKYVSKKMNRLIHFSHIQSVISILLEEIMNDLLEGKEIEIGNFGTFLIKKMLPRRHYNYMTGQCEISVGRKLIRFKLNKKLRRILANNLDIEKTFKDGNNG